MGSVYTSALSIIRVIEDDALSNPVRDAIERSNFTDISLDDALDAELLKNTAVRFEQAYRYGASGDYIYGLPDASWRSNQANGDQVKAVIEAEIGETVIIDYAKLDFLNYIHLGYQTLVADYDYDEASNEVVAKSTEKGFPVYLEDMEPVFRVEDTNPDPESQHGLGKPPQSGYTPERASRDHGTGIGNLSTGYRYRDAGVGEEPGVELHLIWEDDDGVIQRETLFQPLAPYNPALQYYQVKYTYGPTGNQLSGYWTYDPETEQHPTLDGLARLDYSAPGTYFPFLIYVHHAYDFSQPSLEGTERYEASAKLAKYYGMDYGEVGKTLRQNPDFHLAAQAVCMMGVALNSTDDYAMEYLFEYFKDLYDRSPDDADPRYYTGNAMKDNPDVDDGRYEPDRVARPRFELHIRDTDLHMTLSYLTIRRRIRVGNKGKVGSFTSVWENRNFTFANDPPLNIKARVFTKQLSLNVYEEIEVADPKLFFLVTAAKGKGNYADPDTENFIVPLDRAICQRLILADRQKLYERSLHFVFTALDKQDVAWYQTGVFRFILTAIAIVITFATLGADGGATLTFVQIVTQLAIRLVIMLVLNVVFKEIAKIIGPEAAAILAVIVALIGSQMSVNPTVSLQATWAEILVNLPTMLVRMAPQALLSGAGAVLEEEVEAFQEEQELYESVMDQRNEALDEAQALLDTGAVPDPNYFIGLQPLNIPAESPSSFYYRTIHSGNIGAMGFEMTHNFVDHALKLPTFEESVRGWMK